MKGIQLSALKSLCISIQISTISLSVPLANTYQCRQNENWMGGLPKPKEHMTLANAAQNAVKLAIKYTSAQRL